MLRRGAIAPSSPLAPPLDTNSNSECISEEERVFKTDVYDAALDTLLMQLSDRFQAVKVIVRLFKFIVNPPNSQRAVTIKAQAKYLVDQHLNDLVLDNLEDELCHYTKLHHPTSIVKSKALSFLSAIYGKNQIKSN